MDWRAEIDPVFLAVLPSGRSIGDLRLEELGDLYDADDVLVYAAPARADRDADAPATLVTVGAADGLRDEGVEYAQQIASTGANATVLVYPRAPHLFSNLDPNAPVSIQHRHDQREWLRRHLTPPSG